MQPTTFSVLAMVLTLASCYPSEANVMLLRPISGAKPKDASQVDVFIRPDTPSCDYTIVGKVKGTRGNGEELDQVIAAIKTEVGKAGADGAMNLTTAQPGNVGYVERETNADVYVCK